MESEYFWTSKHNIIGVLYVKLMTVQSNYLVATKPGVPWSLNWKLELIDGEFCRGNRNSGIRVSAENQTKKAVNKILE